MAKEGEGCNQHALGTFTRRCARAPERGAAPEENRNSRARLHLPRALASRLPPPLVRTCSLLDSLQGLCALAGGSPSFLFETFVTGDENKRRGSESHEGCSQSEERPRKRRLCEPDIQSSSYSSTIRIPRPAHASSVYPSPPLSAFSPSISLPIVDATDRCASTPACLDRARGEIMTFDPEPYRPPPSPPPTLPTATHELPDSDLSHDHPLQRPRIYPDYNDDGGASQRPAIEPSLLTPVSPTDDKGLIATPFAAHHEDVSEENMPREILEEASHHPSWFTLHDAVFTASPLQDFHPLSGLRMQIPHQHVLGPDATASLDARTTNIFARDSIELRRSDEDELLTPLTPTPPDDYKLPRTNSDLPLSTSMASLAQPLHADPNIDLGQRGGTSPESAAPATPMPVLDGGLWGSMAHVQDEIRQMDVDDTRGKDGRTSPLFLQFTEPLHDPYHEDDFGSPTSAGPSSECAPGQQLIVDTPLDPVASPRWAPLELELDDDIEFGSPSSPSRRSSSSLPELDFDDSDGYPSPSRRSWSTLPSSLDLDLDEPEPPTSPKLNCSPRLLSLPGAELDDELFAFDSIGAAEPEPPPSQGSSLGIYVPIAPAPVDTDPLPAGVELDLNFAPEACALVDADELEKLLSLRRRSWFLERNAKRAELEAADEVRSLAAGLRLSPPVPNALAECDRDAGVLRPPPAGDAGAIRRDIQALDGKRAEARRDRKAYKERGKEVQCLLRFKLGETVAEQQRGAEMQTQDGVVPRRAKTVIKSMPHLVARMVLKRREEGSRPLSGRQLVYDHRSSLLSRAEGVIYGDNDVDDLDSDMMM
ncbi:hypothetical protein PENSPDRAFT_670147 [Peniophora sp. CONT]|nr:hypothetical protein PENSPDRAFT_670147 [Peniophora sp. CONT]